MQGEHREGFSREHLSALRCSRGDRVEEERENRSSVRASSWSISDGWDLRLVGIGERLVGIFPLEWTSYASTAYENTLYLHSSPVRNGDHRRDVGICGGGGGENPNFCPTDILAAKPLYLHSSGG